MSGSITLITGPGVLIEGDAVAQLERVAALPGCVAAVGLPDLHPGPGVPIGAAFAFEGVLRPDLVGGDAGCGARVTAVPRARRSGDDLERRLRAEFDGPPLDGVSPGALARAVSRHGAAGLALVDGVPSSLAGLAELEAAEEAESSHLDPCFAAALGTIGGGNHFAEVSRVSHVRDGEGAAGLRLGPGAHAVVVHSGSRGLGRALVDRGGGAGLSEGDRASQYRRELETASRVARANRLVLTWRLLRALGETRPQSLGGALDIVHNTVGTETVSGRDLCVHRKGSARAGLGEAAIVLGTRGTESWVVSGTGKDVFLSSVAHGAGRRLVRSEAMARLRERFPRASLARTRSGGRVVCDDTALMYEEHPEAYKDIEPVVAALVESGAARRVAALTPVVTVKR